MTGRRMTREEASGLAAVVAGDLCGSQSRQYREGDPRAFFVCSREPHQEGEHTACTGQGFVIARWADGQSKVRVWLRGVWWVV